MDTHHKVYIGLIVGITAFVLFLLGAKEYATQQASNAERDALIKVTEQHNADLQRQNSDLQRQMASDRNEMEMRLASIEKQRAAITTPEQAIKVVHDTVPVSATTTVSALPDAPSVLSQKDAKSLADFGLTCKACEIQRDALTTENSNLKLVAKNDEDQITGLKAERDAAIKASKGGSVWRRTWRVVKVTGCAITGGYLGSKAAPAGSKPGLGAGVGAGAGALVCSLF